MSKMYSPEWVEKEKIKKIEDEFRNRVIDKYNFDSNMVEFSLSYTMPEDLKKYLEELYICAGWDEVCITDVYNSLYTNVFMKRKDSLDKAIDDICND